MRRPRPGGAVAIAALTCALVATALLWAGAGGPTMGKGAREGVSDDAVGASSLGVDVPTGARVTSHESGRSVVDEGASVLEGYQSRGDCVLAHAGYIDLAGRVWACVVQGAGWAEVCVVQEGASGGCEVVSWRMDAGDVDSGSR
ncbi:hypothetical protein ACULPM_01250 [Thermophilibacter sp. ZX-H3]|uniref:hypothetical protein n=1 Tax=unclassified Thermophilibacter TaxID=2847308 RepID=UPI00404086B1